MRVVIPTVGSQGDVQPFIALAQGLARADHTVTLASHPVMRELVEGHDVPFAPIGPDIDLASEVAAIRHRARHPAIGLINGMRFGFRVLEQCHDDILELCQKADLVVVPTAVAAGKNEAELLHLPYVSVTLMPWAIPWQDPERPILKRVLYSAIDGLVYLITTLPLNRTRRRQGLPPVGREGFTSPLLNLVPVSRSVYPPNPHWEPRHRVVGYWFVDEPKGWQPSTDLLAFLDGGEPPLLVSLGAMSLGDDDARENASLFVDAIGQAGVRAVVQGWDARIRQLDLPASVYAAGSLPHSWLLPRCAGIVHHGGFGTTSAGLRAGVPALVIPHIADQFYWAQHLQKLGVGMPFIPRSKLNRQELTSALSELAHDVTLRDKASALGQQIRAENGLRDAVDLIEKTLG